ncbi:hypothetical protein Y032_0150g2733 [Ancylostoma ceylanicum]|uniref:Uncharacterized protein n=1 Tax=Ancylostoma ceylanicum TaxID=53326 RepID=A0A016T141_9BILA|nr:hypothetical protein Y032_0150g2733 [Ancylostoma ceylanicum]
MTTFYFLGGWPALAPYLVGPLDLQTNRAVCNCLLITVIVRLNSRHVEFRELDNDSHTRRLWPMPVHVFVISEEKLKQLDLSRLLNIACY